jgi:hypothetical protein
MYKILKNMDFVEIFLNLQNLIVNLQILSSCESILKLFYDRLFIHFKIKDSQNQNNKLS